MGKMEERKLEVQGRGVTFLRKIGLLYLFWVLLTWAFDLQHLVMGLVVAFMVTVFFENFLLTQKERPHWNLIDFYYVLVFLVVLLWEMLKANLKVAYIVLHPRLPISPGTVQVRTKLRTDLGKVIFANAITLTPGTLTVELEGDLLTIHGLTKGDLVGIPGERLEKILLKIEEE